MAAVQPIPFLMAPFKKTDDVDFSGPLKRYIALEYREDPHSYADACAALNRLRQDMRGATGSSPAVGRDIHYRYLIQLEQLGLRFPIDDRHVKIPFTWHDALTEKPITQHSLAFEKACVIFNLAGMLSVVGATKEITTKPSIALNEAIKAFQAAAYQFKSISDNFLHAPSVDLQKDAISLLTQLMLAQAQECIVAAAVFSMDQGAISSEAANAVDSPNSKTTTKLAIKRQELIAKMASQAAHQYGGIWDALGDLVTKELFHKWWFVMCQSKHLHYQALAQYYQSLADSASGKHGSAVGRMKLAESKSGEAVQFANDFASQFMPNAVPTITPDAGPALQELTQTLHSKAAEQHKQLERDNELVYNSPVPSAASLLSSISKKDICKPIPMTEYFTTGPEIQRVTGTDLFIKLVPMAVHESSSVYSGMKDSLVRTEVESVESANIEMSSALQFMQLPSCLEKFRASTAAGVGASIRARIVAEKPLINRLAEPTDVLKNGLRDLRQQLLELGSNSGDDGESLNTSTLSSRVSGLTKRRTAIRDKLDSITELLDSENAEFEAMQAKYGDIWTQAPSMGSLTGAMRTDLSARNKNLKQAESTDRSLLDRLKKIDQYYALFELPSGRGVDSTTLQFEFLSVPQREQLEEMLLAVIQTALSSTGSDYDVAQSKPAPVSNAPNLIDFDFDDAASPSQQTAAAAASTSPASTSGSGNDADNHAYIASALEKIDALMAGLSTIKQDRRETLEDLKVKAREDDISKELIGNLKGGASEADVFNTQLDKFRSHQTRLEQLHQRQKTILQDITVSLKELMESSAAEHILDRWDTATRARDDLIRDILAASTECLSVFQGVERGMKFYGDLESLVDTLNSTVEQFVNKRRTERESLAMEAAKQMMRRGGSADRSSVPSRYGSTSAASPTAPSAPPSDADFADEYQSQLVGGMRNLAMDSNSNAFNRPAPPPPPPKVPLGESSRVSQPSYLPPHQQPPPAHPYQYPTTAPSQPQPAPIQQHYQSPPPPPLPQQQQPAYYPYQQQQQQPPPQPPQQSYSQPPYQPPVSNSGYPQQHYAQSGYQTNAQPGPYNQYSSAPPAPQPLYYQQPQHHAPPQQPYYSQSQPLPPPPPPQQQYYQPPPPPQQQHQQHYQGYQPAPQHHPPPPPLPAPPMQQPQYHQQQQPQQQQYQPHPYGSGSGSLLD
ncbi:BRO1-domain-containing protein [Ramicandelaber brevisporus]|nr:BRO1-domain-containing protein [Ramicandelaber brevisporus]